MARDWRPHSKRRNRKPDVIPQKRSALDSFLLALRLGLRSQEDEAYRRGKRGWARFVRGCIAHIDRLL